MRCPASPRHALLAENLGKPSLWVIISAPWYNILSNPEAPKVDCRGARAHLLGELGVVLCYEIIGGSVLTATNLFLREDGAWRMVHHHAGPCGAPPAEIAEEPPEEPMQ